MDASVWNDPAVSRAVHETLLAWILMAQFVLVPMYIEVGRELWKAWRHRAR